MIAKRIIPCLDIKDGRTVKGTNFVSLRDAGDPLQLAGEYSRMGADELIFLDITATLEKRKTLVDLVSKLSKTINIPFSVGGGIDSVDIAYEVLQSGADKISINSAAIKNPRLISDCSRRFGAQCVIIAVDAKCIDGQWMVHTHGGTRTTDLDLFDWIREAEQLGAGEVLFTSMDHDGTKQGFAVDALRCLNESIAIPIIASGGAGSVQHFVDVFKQTDVSAALAASIFHFQEVKIQELKQTLSHHQIKVRL
jgi:imidazole glycerol-phosphate synthase subunit HisF